MGEYIKNMTSSLLSPLNNDKKKKNRPNETTTEFVNLYYFTRDNVQWSIVKYLKIARYLKSPQNILY